MTSSLRGNLVAPLTLLLARLAPLPKHGRIAGMPSLCLFHLLTGHPCPGCGFTRSVVCCAHFRWSDAVLYHPLGPLLYLILVIWSVVGLARIARRATTPIVNGWVVRLAPGIALCLLMGIWFARLLNVLPSPP